MQELFLMRVREAAINMWEAWDTGQDADDVWVLGGWVRRSSTTKSHRACDQNVPISVTTGAHIPLLKLAGVRLNPFPSTCPRVKPALQTTTTEQTFNQTC